MSEYPKPIAYNPFLAVMLNFLQNQTYTYIHLHIHTFIHIYIKFILSDQCCTCLLTCVSDQMEDIFSHDSLIQSV